MGIRETINERPLPTLIVVIVLAAAGLFFALHRGGPSVAKLPSRSYYSDDDGKTWYIDDARNVPPYDHNGKEAVRVYLYQCGDGKPFVQHLEKFDDNAKEAIAIQMKAGIPPLEAQQQTIGIQVKRPGDDKWIYVKTGLPAEMGSFLGTLQPKCPDGMSGIPRRVTVEENAPSP